ncbi:MAG: histidine kinase, partial [Noviherbaspirillum sp.]
DRHQSAQALRHSEARFRAIVSNTPGLVFQFLLRNDGSVAFPYLSAGCHALLGVTAERLRADSALFLELILPEDRQSYLDSMAASAADMKAWNWEGRIWVERWKDIKWINIRSTPRAIPGDAVQWEGIMTNITQSKREEGEIKRSREQLAELSAHVEKVKEDERMRIAREIHDDLGGNLTAIKMALALVTRRLPPEDKTLAEKTEYVDALVDRTIEAVHRISVDLRPGILDFGIVAAIDWQAKEFEKQIGIPCCFSSNKKDITLHPDQSTALFRIFQEALTNIGKHAHATRVTVKLVRTNRGVRLEITDNGRGIAARDRIKPKSFGIRGMIERASALGGQLTVSNAPGGGSMVALRMPLSAPQEKILEGVL